jgi:hypothetical protein
LQIHNFAASQKADDEEIRLRKEIGKLKLQLQGEE